ncbi:MAG: hypothetical protein AAGF11_55475, partial [Myxococcota bacterium]
MIDMTHRHAVLARFALVAGVAGVGSMSFAKPARAEVCDCAPSLQVRAPADEGVLPDNGLVVIEAECGADPTDLEVYVDGQRAHLVPERGRMVGTGHRILPEPEEGAFVEIYGCAHPSGDGDENADEDDCDPTPAPADLLDDDATSPGRIEWTFTVGERDEIAPLPPVLGGLDYLRADITDGCDLEDTPRAAREWSLPVDGQADEPVLYPVSVGPAGAREPTRTRRVVLEGDADLELTLLRFTEDAGHDVCATVRTFDLTGNEADPVQV